MKSVLISESAEWSARDVFTGIWLAVRFQTDANVLTKWRKNLNLLNEISKDFIEYKTKVRLSNYSLHFPNELV